jgi:hypothetical protein
MSTKESGLSLKSDTKQKMKSSPSMGQTVSTGSGLTNILKREDDDFSDLEDNSTYVMGSLKSPLAEVYEEEAAEAAYRRKKESDKVISTIIKIIVLGLIAFGIYYVVVNYILVKKGADTYEEALAIYVEAVNSQDVDKMKEIVAPYLSDTTNRAEGYLDDMRKANIVTYDIDSVSTMTSEEKNSVLEQIQLSYNKAPYITDACTVTVEMKGTVTSDSGNVVNKGHKVDMDFLEIDGQWYFYADTYDNPTFTQ